MPRQRQFHLPQADFTAAPQEQQYESIKFLRAYGPHYLNFPLHCRAFHSAVKLRTKVRNEIRHYCGGLNPVITGLNCPAYTGQ